MVWLRAQLVQFADAVRLPILWAVFRDPAAVGDSAVAISCWLFALGLFAPWVGVANKAIIAECAPPAVLGSAVAMNAALEGIFSALFGGPLVGWRRGPPGGARRGHPVLAAAQARAPRWPVLPDLLGRGPRGVARPPLGDRGQARCAGGSAGPRRAESPLLFSFDGAYIVSFKTLLTLYSVI